MPLLALAVNLLAFERRAEFAQGNGSTIRRGHRMYRLTTHQPQSSQPFRDHTYNNFLRATVGLAQVRPTRAGTKGRYSLAS